MFYRRFHGEYLWRSKEEQAWLDEAPVGREFDSPDFKRLQVLDLYAAGEMNAKMPCACLTSTTYKRCINNC